MGAGVRLASTEPQDPFVSWLSDARGYAQALKEHRETGKPLLIYFYTDWCPYCRRLNQDILASAQVQGYLGEILKVRVNPEHGTKESMIAGRYGIMGFPTIVMFSAHSSLPRRLFPYRLHEAGWVLMTPDEFVEACKVLAALDD